MNYILFDGPYRDHLLPLTYTKPVADLRIGILTIREKWEKMLDTTTTSVTEDYLSVKFPMVEMAENIMICGSVLPNEDLVKLVKELQPGQAIYQKDELLAFYARENEEVDLDAVERKEFEGELIDSQEGLLRWIPDVELLDLNLWAGDLIFIPWLQRAGFFSGKFVYRDGELVDHHVTFHEP